MRKYFLLLAMLILCATSNAALDVKKGSFIRQSGTGTQAITGLGFQPTAIIFFGTNQTSEGVQADATTYFGVADETNGDRGLAQFANDADGGTGGARIDTNAIIIVISATPTFSAIGDLKTMDTDGFTIDWTTNDGTLSIVHYFAIGGDADSTLVGNSTFPATTGNFSVTGVGFQPKVVIQFGYGKMTTVPSNQTKPFEKTFFSMITSSTNRHTLATSFRAQPAKVGKAVVEFVDTLSIETQKDVTTLETKANFVSMDTDGWTQNATLIKSAYEFGWLAIGGGPGLEIFLGTETQNTSTGTKATTGVGFEPEGLFMMTVGNTGGASADGNMAFGASDGTTEGTIGGATQDNPTTDTKCDEFNITTKAIRMFSPGATPTTDAEADLSSFDTDGFTLDWTTADGTARKFLYLAMRGGGPGGTIIWNTTEQKYKDSIDFALIDQGQATSNFGSSSSGVFGSIGGDNQWFVMRVNCSCLITNGLLLDSVKMELTVLGGKFDARLFGGPPDSDTLQIAFYQIDTTNRDWVEDQVTWNNYKTASAWTTGGVGLGTDAYSPKVKSNLTQTTQDSTRFRTFRGTTSAPPNDDNFDNSFNVSVVQPVSKTLVWWLPLEPFHRFIEGGTNNGFVIQAFNIIDYGSDGVWTTWKTDDGAGIVLTWYHSGEPCSSGDIVRLQREGGLRSDPDITDRSGN